MRSIKFFSVGIFITLMIVSKDPAFAQSYNHESNQVQTKVGNPGGVTGGGSGNGGCWPTTGQLTQGPQAGNHARYTGRAAVDIAGTGTTTIYATFDGQATVYYEPNTSGYGNYVSVKSTDGKFSVIFAHMSIVYAKNTAVKVGDKLGIQGATGEAQGIHLHWEVQGIPLTPPFIPQPITPLSCTQGKCSPNTVDFNQSQCTAPAV